MRASGHAPAHRAHTTRCVAQASIARAHLGCALHATRQDPEPAFVLQRLPRPTPPRVAQQRRPNNWAQRRRESGPSAQGSP
ncbi:hypothetical protein CERSUDRAFT_113639 [Gelatoporia subvermispora B]|uniref:Uncharacterized protein n=1 Tax=Ceriporiopsis subvermispora (strain B) TaxID=914234 RepID=M2PPP0_CERS8|nr:hypothetical protein CERSUDRAFT_113639 [Gelatoporia subvermispora B]